jgi:hypothetical protein
MVIFLMQDIIQAIVEGQKTIQAIMLIVPVTTAITAVQTTNKITTLSPPNIMTIAITMVPVPITAKDISIRKLVIAAVELNPQIIKVVDKMPALSEEGGGAVSGAGTTTRIKVMPVPLVRISAATVGPKKVVVVASAEAAATVKVFRGAGIWAGAGITAWQTIEKAIGVAEAGEAAAGALMHVTGRIRLRRPRRKRRRW